MPAYSFTDEVRRSLQAAREETAGRGEAGVGPEHLLLGILRVGGADLGAVFKNISLDPASVVQSLAASMPIVSTPPRERRDFPYTLAAMQVLKFAQTEAGELGYAYVGSEHLVLGILREGSSLAARVLAAHQITLHRMRDALARWTPPAGG